MEAVIEKYCVIGIKTVGILKFIFALKYYLLMYYVYIIILYIFFAYVTSLICRTFRIIFTLICIRSIINFCELHLFFKHSITISGLNPHKEFLFNFAILQNSHYAGKFNYKKKIFACPSAVEELAVRWTAIIRMPYR